MDEIEFPVKSDVSDLASDIRVVTCNLCEDLGSLFPQNNFRSNIFSIGREPIPSIHGVFLMPNGLIKTGGVDFNGANGVGVVSEVLGDADDYDVVRYTPFLIRELAQRLQRNIRSYDDANDIDRVLKVLSLSSDIVNYIRSKFPYPEEEIFNVIDPGSLELMKAALVCYRNYKEYIHDIEERQKSPYARDEVIESELLRLFAYLRDMNLFGDDTSVGFTFMGKRIEGTGVLIDRARFSRGTIHRLIFGQSGDILLKRDPKFVRDNAKLITLGMLRCAIQPVFPKLVIGSFPKVHVLEYKGIGN